MSVWQTVPRRKVWFGWMERNEFEDFGIPKWCGIAFRQLAERNRFFIAPLGINYLLFCADWLYWRVRWPHESKMKCDAMSIVARDRMNRGYQPRHCWHCGKDWQDAP
jgi:hypothetical protein